jgi:hypothetical protein
MKPRQMMMLGLLFHRKTIAREMFYRPFGKV